MKKQKRIKAWALITKRGTLRDLICCSGLFTIGKVRSNVIDHKMDEWNDEVVPIEIRILK